MDTATAERLSVDGNLPEPASVVGPCRASGGAIECALSDGRFEAVDEPWRSAAAKQIALAALGCFDGAITGIEDAHVVRGVNCVRDTHGNLDEYRRDVAVLLGEPLPIDPPAPAEAATRDDTNPASGNVTTATGSTGDSGTDHTLGVPSAVIAAIREGAAAVRADGPSAHYFGPVFTGTRNAVLYTKIYRGLFGEIVNDDRVEAMATHVALLTQHSALIRRFG